MDTWEKWSDADLVTMSFAVLKRIEDPNTAASDREIFKRMAHDIGQHLIDRHVITQDEYDAAYS